jgi:hypothetical protein
MTGIDLPPVDYAAHKWAESAGKPFRHLVWPGALTPEDARLCGDEYPAPESGAWHTFTGELEQGKQEGVAAIAGPNVAELHHTLNGPLFMDWLRRATGLPHLYPDPDRVGGGIHQSGPGARLGLHVDFNLHPTRHYLVRAVNLIVFVGDQNPWLLRTHVADWGGLLELGAPSDPDRIEMAPVPSDMVIFEAADDSWHGHPVPLAEDAPLRKSVPAYYYRPLADGEQVAGRSTRFLATQ